MYNGVITIENKNLWKHLGQQEGGVWKEEEERVEMREKTE